MFRHGAKTQVFAPWLTLNSRRKISSLLNNCQNAFNGREELDLDRGEVAHSSVPVHDKAERHRRPPNHHLSGEALGVELWRWKLPAFGIGGRVWWHRLRNLHGHGLNALELDQRLRLGEERPCRTCSYQETKL